MQVITTTQLRTKSKDLIKALNQGKQIDLIHRSKVVGQIQPKKQLTKIFDAEKFLHIVKSLNLPTLTDKQIAIRYRKAMKLKYGKSISRHK